MKKILFFAAFLLAGHALFSQVQSYYNDVDLTKTGMDLKDELSLKISSTHTVFVTYSQLWDVLRQTDEVTTDTSKVYLMYGWENGTDGDCHNDIMRNKYDNGGTAANCEWNREHVYPKSLGTPAFTNNDTVGADPHHIRPSDVSMNGSRGNKKFADATGNAGTVNANFWYPGDEWKGDVARIIMYLYLRYGDRCQPVNVGTGPAVSTDPGMLQLFLEWNAQDPPSPVEDRRNNVLETLQGNRNPFIDNPYLATIIWGGPPATDRWNMSVAGERLARKVKVYPNPARDEVFIILKDEQADFRLVSADGKVLFEETFSNSVSWKLNRLPGHIYFIHIRTRDGVLTVKKLIKQ